MQPIATTRLCDLGAVRVRGADTVRFLQGQLSNDVALLTPAQSSLAGLHNLHGRVVAVLRLMAVGADEVIAVLPRELAAPVAARLARYVLRAKVQVSDASDEWLFCGLISVDSAELLPSVEVAAASRDNGPRLSLPGAASPELAASPHLPRSLNEQAAHESSLIVRVDHAPARWLSATLTARSGPESGGWAADTGAASRERWRAFDIAAGVPQVYAATSEQFVAQMLNLDVIGAISFTKGCYTGQEVIARAHYRGRVKRRMQRFRTQAPARLAPGEAGTLRDGRGFRIVEAVSLADGRCEFLAVAPMSHGESGKAEAVDAPANASAAASLDAEPLALPYELPA